MPDVLVGHTQFKTSEEFSLSRLLIRISACSTTAEGWFRMQQDGLGLNDWCNSMEYTWAWSIENCCGGCTEEGCRLQIPWVMSKTHGGWSGTLLLDEPWTRWAVYESHICPELLSWCSSQQSNIESVLVYECETWTLTPVLERSIRGCNHTIYARCHGFRAYCMFAWQIHSFTFWINLKYKL